MKTLIISDRVNSNKNVTEGAEFWTVHSNENVTEETSLPPFFSSVRLRDYWCLGSGS